MGRVRQNIEVAGKKRWTLFDTDARNTYVVPDVAATLRPERLPRLMRAALGGRRRLVRETALLRARVAGKLVSTQAMVVEEIGRDEEGRVIEVLFGALAMQQWSIRPVPDEERLDMSHFPREFVEFFDR